GALRDPRAAGPLAAALHDPEATVRAKAAEALGRIGDRSAIEALTAALNDPSRAVQAQAAGALLELGAPLGFEGLLAALENEDIEIRLRAVLGLRALGDERAIAPLEQCAKNNRYLEVFVNDAIERIRDAQPRTPARAP
ncbi:MAG TPA: HEAT repeat domain-containing protein, partial [Planctomycetota bacterium]|nr:HEAT repeat domain-containing protein [Planctomycetota bacterium]